MPNEAPVNGRHLRLDPIIEPNPIAAAMLEEFPRLFQP
jgi:hypothetical protein